LLQLLLRCVRWRSGGLGSELDFPDRFASGLYASKCLRTGLLPFGAASSEEIGMSDDPVATATDKQGLTLDWWAVLLAIVLALLVRVGVLQHIPW
jgi:hypothetical protein